MTDKLLKLLGKRWTKNDGLYEREPLVYPACCEPLELKEIGEELERGVDDGQETDELWLDEYYED